MPGRETKAAMAVMFSSRDEFHLFVWNHSLRHHLLDAKLSGSVMISGLWTVFVCRVRYGCGPQWLCFPSMIHMFDSRLHIHGHKLGLVSERISPTLNGYGSCGRNSLRGFSSRYEAGLSFCMFCMVVV